MCQVPFHLETLYFPGIYPYLLVMAKWEGELAFESILSFPMEFDHNVCDRGCGSRCLEVMRW